ncbi:hypothetical protein OPKNFCMD_6771 [Methylobacterium crusticola]|uniref:Alcohol dehydrogenase-like C-terminal domain-containing protein n=1 Tax=Methylobacterium crusticola TaxID=1697972 RepID=A0ABQ4RB41_9HYPH|nr:hypothetical protein OPKNFCMD_6771 [Methylobacterium crusticola]
MIGADRVAPPDGGAIRDHADLLLIDEPDLPAAVWKATDGRGAAVIYDCVGGKTMFEIATRCLAHKGRLIEISATGDPIVQFNLADFYHNETRLFGVDSLKHDLVQCARTLDALRPDFESGRYRPAPIAATYGLDDAKAAYSCVTNGAQGRIVLTPQL